MDTAERRPAGRSHGGIRQRRQRKPGPNGGHTARHKPPQASEYVDIPVVTGMGDGRNYINALSSDVVVALPGGAGTISEISLALKNRKTVILLNFDTREIFRSFIKAGLLKQARTPEETVQIIKSEIIKL